MSNLEVGGQSVSPSNPLAVYQANAPAAAAGATVNRALVAAATTAGGAQALASNALRVGAIFTNTSGANAYLTGAGATPVYSTTEASSVWDVKIPPQGTLVMDRNLLLPGRIMATFDGAPGGYLHASEVTG